MASVGFSILLSLCTLLTITNSWSLPNSCHPHRPPSPPSTPIHILYKNNDNTTNTTDDPTANPTTDPTKSPSIDPTTSPSTNPTFDPTESPTIDPTKSPTTDPTNNPTLNPTPYPTYPSKPPTTSPTRPYDVDCCRDIKKMYFYSANQDNSTCLPAHERDSCTLNSQQKIEEIYLEYCQLTGSIPNELKAMNSLRALFLGYNQITGSIPGYFNNFTAYPNLQDFRVQNNDLSGYIPFNLFQYTNLVRMDFRDNYNLKLYITKMNMTYTPSFGNKQAINVNFSFIQPIVDNDTDASFYTFLERLNNTNSFSMRSSINNFTFKWQNKDSKGKYHKPYAINTFDLYGNNLTGEFPCFWNSWPRNLYLANNFITDWNVSCFGPDNRPGGFSELMIFQQYAAYESVAQCYENYGQWATANDHHAYCMYADYVGSPPLIKNCCSVIPSPPTTLTPTMKPTHGAFSSDTGAWLIDHVEYFVLGLILSFGFVIYFLWKRKNKKRHKQAVEITERGPVHRKPTKSTDDKESLLYGDF